jgi:ADP-ribose pyrophosphatase YjhB (NUDIX family)
LHIYGNAEVGKVYEESVRREMRDEVRQNICFHEILPFVPFQTQDGYTVTALIAQHSQVETAYVYLIEKDGISYLHLTDTGRLPMETLNYLQNVFALRKDKITFVCFDCTFLFATAGEVSRHMGLEDNANQKQQFLLRGIVDEDTQYAITHYSHNADASVERLAVAKEKYAFIPTFDGFEIEITKK